MKVERNKTNRKWDNFFSKKKSKNNKYIILFVKWYKYSQIKIKYDRKWKIKVK